MKNELTEFWQTDSVVSEVDVESSGWASECDDDGVVLVEFACHLVELMMVVLLECLLSVKILQDIKQNHSYYL